jgi:hypothetical protein
MKVKGSALRSTLKFASDHYPEKTVRAVMESLPAEHRSELGKSILAGDWYDAGLLHTYMHALARASGDPEDDLFYRIGRQSCDDGLNSLYRMFFKVGSPHFILKRVPQIWGNYYDAGRMTLVEGTPLTALIRLEGTHFPDEALCHRIRGWMVRAIELSGGKQITIVHTACVHHGQAVCEWKGNWELK